MGVGLRKRYLPWLVTAAVAAVGMPALAFGQSAAPPTKPVYASDPYSFFNPETGESSVTIAAGGTVTFAYPESGSIHNVAFDNAQPTSCTLAGSSANVPPLPPISGSLSAGWS